MSVIDDSRVLLQDIVAPDLKAIAARLDALEKSIQDRFSASEALNKQRFEAVNHRFDDVSQRFTAAEKLNEARYEALLNAVQTANTVTNAKIDSLEKNLSLAHRMELLEARFGTQNQGTIREERP